MIQSPTGRRWVRLAAGRPEWRTGWRLIASSAAVVLVGVAGLGLAARQFAFTATVWVAIAAFAPYAELGAVVSLVIFAVGRGLVGLVLSVACLGGLVITHAGLYIADTAPKGPVLTVLTANLKIGGANARDLVQTARARHIDVLMVQELTGPELRALGAAGLAAVLPYSISEAHPLYAGTGLWSRYPLSHVAHRSDFLNAFVTASIRPSVAMPEVQLASLHLPGPFPVSTEWTRDIEHLRRLLARWPGRAPVVIGGDFNATPDTPRFRRLSVGGFTDAADQAGAGLTATFPADLWFPPLIAIDHILVRDAVATDVRTLTNRGSDHRALLVKIRIAG